MRQLKTFMRNRKAEMLGCGPCECRTLQCWRYANENCNCGENVTPPVPPVPPTPTTYTVTFEASPINGGSVDVQSIEVEAGARVSYNSNSELEIGGTTVIATAAEGYINDGWVGPEEIGENTTITANFIEYIPLESITAPEENAIQITEGGYGHISFNYTPTNATYPYDEIDVQSSDINIAQYVGAGGGDGHAVLDIYGASQGNCTITYSFGGTSYSVDVEVTPGL